MRLSVPDIADALGNDKLQQTCPILKGKVGAGVPFFKWTVAKYNQPQFIADGKDCFLEM